VVWSIIIGLIVIFRRPFSSVSGGLRVEPQLRDQGNHEVIFAVALKTLTIIKHVVIHILLRNESLGQPTGSLTGIQEYRYYRGTPKNILSTAQTWHRAVPHSRKSGTPLTKKRYPTHEKTPPLVDKP
jgi:hypothetical protein